jgi:hypothetical protein
MISMIVDMESVFDPTDSTVIGKLLMGSGESPSISPGSVTFMVTQLGPNSVGPLNFFAAVLPHLFERKRRGT